MHGKYNWRFLIITSLVTGMGGYLIAGRIAFHQYFSASWRLNYL
ncbi:MAG TPA: hypothetical protein VJ203_03910 [Bacteroidales bacterium]|nr:hypothetical protein [Bacteroidales bacterium]